MPTLVESPELIIQQTARAYQEHHNPSLARLLKLSGLDTVEFEGNGAILTDVRGKDYIDCLGGYGVFALGHRHPKVVQAVADQLQRLPLSGKVFFNKPLGDLCVKLAEVTPEPLRFSFIANSGTEAVEGALKLAWLSTGRRRVVHAENAFHGKTLGSLSASGRPQYKAPFEPLLPEFAEVPFGDTRALDKTVTGETAAVILEPIQGEGGVRLPPPDYLKNARDICTRNGALLILDEVQTGLGRTGKWFACEHFGVVPDIMVLAKALGGGVMPIGAFVGTDSVWSAFRANPLIHTSTFGGNPLACRAALATLKVIAEDHLPEKAAQLGNFLQGLLKETAREFPEIIREVRGIGLMIGVELTDAKYGGYLIPEMCKQGVLVAYTLNQARVIRFEPPLIVEKSQLQQAAAAFSRSVEKAKAFFDKAKVTTHSVR